jgi:hypothetical protein
MDIDSDFGSGKRAIDARRRPRVRRRAAVIW